MMMMISNNFTSMFSVPRVSIAPRTDAPATTEPTVVVIPSASDAPPTTTVALSEEAKVTAPDTFSITTPPDVPTVETPLAKQPTSFLKNISKEEALLAGGAAIVSLLTGLVLGNSGKGELMKQAEKLAKDVDLKSATIQSLEARV
jgi:hypothetical protein